MEGKMIAVFKNVTQFYGNGIVYITDQNRVERFAKHNFEVTSIKHTKDDLWITSGVVVALGCTCDPQSAIDALGSVIARIRSELDKDQ
jgi:hypothetical protein